MINALIFVLTIILFSNLSTILSEKMMTALNLGVVLFINIKNYSGEKFVFFVWGFVVYLILDAVFDILTNKLEPYNH